MRERVVKACPRPRSAQEGTRRRRGSPVVRGIVGLVAVVSVVCAAWVVPNAHAGPPASKVVLNGVPAPVYFNDGDSFRILSGEYAGMKGRLAGFNTLESHGPVHQWGDWTFKELYVLAKMATYNARNGEWTCESDLSTDTYGRTLWWCESLAVDQVRRGFAHALSVDGPSPQILIDAQQEAIANKAGIWAHGVPEYVLTSTHSVTEGGGRDGRTYNRLVSSADGHSEKWRHTDEYGECENVCQMTATTDPIGLESVVAGLKTDGTLAAFVGEYSDEELATVAERFYRYGIAGRLKEKDHEPPMTAALEAFLEGGTFGPYEATPASCMIYVDFRRRFGGGKAECLK